MTGQGQAQGSEIIDFYRGRTAHPCGLSIDQVWALTDPELDRNEAAIAWMFPLNRGDTSRSPVIRRDEMDGFARDPELRRRLMRSFTRMLSYYGFEIRTAGAVLRVSPAAEFAEKSRRWVFPHSPQYKRITRILESVSRLGLRDAARPFLDALRALYCGDPGTIGNTTLLYWTDAVSE